MANNHMKRSLINTTGKSKQNNKISPGAHYNGYCLQNTPPPQALVTMWRNLWTVHGNIQWCSHYGKIVHQFSISIAEKIKT